MLATLGLILFLSGSAVATYGELADLFRSRHRSLDARCLYDPR